MAQPSSSDSIYDSSDASSEELQRMRLWIDNDHWDVLGTHPDMDRDIQWARLLLVEGKIASSFRYSDVSRSSERSTQLPLDGIPEDGLLLESPASPLIEQQEDFQQHGPVDHPESDEPGANRFFDPKFLGAGAFGVVFSVKDALLGMRVSIKLLRPSRSNSLQLRHRFLAEARATARLSHSGIVRIFETGQIGPLPYITASYIEGGSLSEFLTRTKPTHRQSAWLLLKIADAVHHAHSNAVLHRDLKPSNILMAKSDEEGTEKLGLVPLLTDFGLAKRMDAEGSLANLTNDGSMLGTLRYASPEQARGAIDEIDTTSDVFSLGVILYEMLVGQVPFDSKVEHVVSHLINETDPRRPREVDSTIPRDLEAIALKCLAKRKDDRYLTAHDLWLDLDRFLNGEPVEAQPSTALRRFGYSARKHPFIAAVIAATILVNVVAISGLYVAWTRSTTALRVEQAAREQERLAKEQEKVAKENERESKQRERDVLVGIVSIFAELGDLIQAGSPVDDRQWLSQLERSTKFLSSHCEDNPNDEAMLHRLSVLKHYLSITHQTLGQYADCWRERIEVEKILTQLIQSNPDKRLYRFQCFHSRLLLGQFYSYPDFQKEHPEIDGVKMQEEALQLIEYLASKYPDNVDYLDALAATKLSIAVIYSESDPDRCYALIDQAIETSEQLWRRYPERHLFAKYAIRGSSLKGIILAGKDESNALSYGRKAVELFEEAWRPRGEERWVITEGVVIYSQWVDTLIASQKSREALDALVECERLRDQQERLYPITSISVVGRMADKLRRFNIYNDLGEQAMIKEVEDQMIQIVEGSREVPNAITLLLEADPKGSYPPAVVARIREIAQELK